MRKDFVYYLLSDKMEEERARQLSDVLTSGTWTHDYPIDSEQLKKLEVFLLQTGLVYDSAYLNHDTGSHVEGAGRLIHTHNYLQKSGVLEKLARIKPRPASLEEVSMVHLPEYIQKVKDFSDRGGGSFGYDNVGSRETFSTALLAVGGTLTAVEQVMDKKVDNAFALVRPPGHHATAGQGMGFCFFNNVAVGARYALKKYGLSRVLVVDWDEHHGNGTEHIFYGDPSVLYFSVHRDWSFPGTGLAEKTGAGEGEGYNINVPLPRGSGDVEYQLAFKEILKPVALKYNPEIIFLSAGMDAHRKDPIGQMNMTSEGYWKLTEIVCEIAGSCCGGALVTVLEGGYNQQALAESVLAVLIVMAGWGQPSEGDKGTPKPNALRAIEHVKKIQARYWPL
ncbi:MAG TPA: histone deacetylase [Bacillota bacterium]|nr:histone deacetylase [Bacillota bacterium]